jgi:hypothetical protein
MLFREKQKVIDIVLKSGKVINKPDKGRRKK